MKMPGIVLLTVCALSLGAVESENAVNLWSGREQTMPRRGRWMFTTGHGRIIASGDGEIKLNLPALKDGTALDAILTVNNVSRKVKIWSPKILLMPSSKIAKLNKHIINWHWRSEDVKVRVIENITQTDGIETLYFPDKRDFSLKIEPHQTDGIETCLYFPDKRDFPLKIEPHWTEISLHRAKIPGSLSVLLDIEEQMLDNRGSFSYVIMRDKKNKVIVFSPEFDFDNIENIILIKNLIKEQEK